MGTEVITISECELCGGKNTRDGAEAFVPPVGWWELQLVRREEGSGWTNSYTITKLLCPGCAEKVTTLLGEE